MTRNEKDMWLVIAILLGVTFLFGGLLVTGKSL